MKSRHNTELKVKKQLLHKRQLELEELIRYEWNDIKTNFVSDTVTYGKSVLFNKAMNIAKRFFRKKK